jgi:hypothetical protein
MAKPRTMVEHMRTLQGKRGQPPIRFKEGGLHESTGTPQDKPIPKKKHRAARAGKLGKKALAQELFYENVLSKGRKGRGR